jgi:alanine racemase
MATEFKPCYTDSFVAERTWSIGTTKFGYGDTEEKALAASEEKIFDEAFGEFVSVRVWARTNESKKIGKTLHFRYNTI